MTRIDPRHTRPSRRIEARVARVYVIPLTKSEMSVIARAVAQMAAVERESVHSRAVLEMLERPVESTVDMAEGSVA